MTAFHPRCGERVVFLHNNTTASRAIWEFNHGIVLSNTPLSDNTLFQVRIERAIPSWSGSIEIGVLACDDPSQLELPSSATELTSGSWILSGTTILQNGNALDCHSYGPDLDRLGEGDVIGVMRTDKGELKLYVNGVSQGVAAEGIPQGVYALVNLYGRCAQVSVLPPESESETSCMLSSIEVSSPLSLGGALSLERMEVSDRLRFHTRHGLLVKLSGGGRTAERQRPLDEFNNGVVMTHRPLNPDELFEIRIDRLVDKWSGSIEVGVTTHDPSHLDFPATMTNMRSGTTIMSGCGILTNGKGTRREYGDFNLDELREGDRIGMVRQASGELHYFINGLDQGVAAELVPVGVWGVVDLYGMTVKVTIVDRDAREEQNLMVRRRASLREQPAIALEPSSSEPCDSDRLTFHPSCGSHAAVINHGRTVHRPNANDDFNNGVVLTARPLRPNEMFEVRLDRLVRKWAGSVEIGVTSHNPLSLTYPTTMTNVRSGTWMMTGNGVMHNGQTIIDEYGHNLDKLEEGDRVAVCWKQDGSLHFFVNGVDQGVAAVNVPGNLYGVLDLYGQAAQATLVDARDYSPDSDNSCISNLTLSSELRFYHVHGRNARVSNNGLTASRPRTLGEFNNAIVMTNRPLRPGEMLQVQIDVLVDRWSGSIEAGVTSMRPEEVEFPSTMTELVNTWVLSGANVIKNGITLKSGYACDLDALPQGSRLGIMRHLDGSLHFYVNGMDQGTACEGVPSTVYGVIDLYGQCAQVSIVPSHLPAHLHPSSSETQAPQPLSVAHRFSPCCGRNMTLESSRTVAVRAQGYAHGLVFSALPLDNDQLFEICLEEVATQWAGSLRFGVTTLPISDSLQSGNLPASLTAIVVDTWYLSGCDVYKTGQLVTPNYCPNLEWLAPGQKIGLKKSADGTLRFYLEGNDLGIAATDLPRRVFAVVDVTGGARKIAVISKQRAPTSQSLSTSLKMQDSLEIVAEGLPTPTLTRLDDVPEMISPLPGPEMGIDDVNLSEYHGRNIEMVEGRSGAKRVASYNQGLVVSQRPLPRGRLFQVRVDQINADWACGLAIGVTGARPSYLQGPVNALSLKHSTWLVTGEHVLKNGKKIRGGYPLGDTSLSEGSTIGVLVDSANQLHVFIDGRDLGVACSHISGPVHALIDLNGRISQISVIGAKAAGLEKADLEVQEKVPQRLGKIEQKLSSSDSYNSGIQQISSHAASSSLQSDTDNFNTQIQQLTLDLQRSQNAGSGSSSAASPTPTATVLPISPAGQPVTPKSRPSPRQCSYFTTCSLFCQALGLPDGFFSRDEPACFCSDCYGVSDGAEAYIVKGRPARESSVPVGWACFPLKPHPSATAQADETWHIAFTGTSPGVIRRILDSGELMGGTQPPLLTSSSNKERDNHVVFSPSLVYASSEHFTTSYWWTDRGRHLEATLALQVLVLPDSYKVGPPSAGAAAATLDPRFQREATEWVPKERGATVLSHLLVRMRGNAGRKD